MNAIRMMKEAMADAARRWPDLTAEELCEAATELFDDWMRDAAHDRESIEDTPCLESCDTGSGEGRWHGRIG